MLPHQTSVTKYLFAVFFIIVLVYAYITARDMLYGPRIIVDAPAEGITVASSVVEITGTVENVSVLRLAGTIIPVDENGAFAETLVVAPGINAFVLLAEDTFGRSRQETITILYSAPQAEKPTETEPDLSPLEAPSAPTNELVE